MKTDQIYDLFRKSTGISTDSRTIKPGEIFFALWGENFNGNKFVDESLGRGASWAVIDDPIYETESTILVDDCLFELQDLASHHRKMMNVPVLAITGTNGKTTTKELIAAILSKKLKVHYTKGNLNNHIGVPLTILAAPPDAEMMIIEMGANHIGEIRSLCLIARPDFGIITNMGTAHIEGFGSFEGVVKAKSELYEYLRKVNGVALYNDKNPILSEKIFKMINRAVPFSDPTGIELKLEVVNSDIFLKLRATYHNKSFDINSNLFGAYNYENMKAAIAAGLFFDVPMENIVEAVENYHPENNRSQVLKTENNTLICDSYNANPTSMLMAVQSFADLPSDHKMIILGDMLELGEKSESEHIRVLQELKSLNPELVYLAGPVFNRLSGKYGYRSFENTGKLMDHLIKKPVKGFTILIKGSRMIGLEKIYELL
ncbi:MAG TPA: UDP-N-acetylmuramoyl-tripeptide--D-alanyl-D-alanine ligase [Bacteroidales bacterium]|nr:UDP-N-acetylmuramoyl-tripeptide--D-alanyl-D-alanine ligase [Bacteroidales bacterium]